MCPYVKSIHWLYFQLDKPLDSWSAHALKIYSCNHQEKYKQVRDKCTINMSGVKVPNLGKIIRFNIINNISSKLMIFNKFAKNKESAKYVHNSQEIYFMFFIFMSSNFILFFLIIITYIWKNSCTFSFTTSVNSLLVACSISHRPCAYKQTTWTYLFINIIEGVERKFLKCTC